MESDDGTFAAVAKMREHDRDKVWAEFLIHPLRNDARSREEGRECFDDTEYVRIVVPMDRTSEVFQPATQKDKERFPREYEAFKKKQDQEVGSGTPLKEWSMLTRSHVEELRYFGVRTVEQLANVSDGHLGKYMGLAGLREKARKWLETAKDVSAVVSKHESEMTQLKGQNEQLEKQVRELAEKLNQMQQAPSAPAGRR